MPGCRHGEFIQGDIRAGERLTVALVSFALLLCGCASLPDNSDRIASYAFTDTGATQLGRDFAGLRRRNAGQDGFLLLGNGLDAFTARAMLAEAAERSLDVQYYLYHDDMVGGLFTAFLWRAAERGVRVRLLVDDMDLDGEDRGIVALDAHPNIDIRIFNPFDRSFSRLPQFVTGLGSLTRRMHNKSFIADNTAAILGGRNIGDEYFDADPGLAFADLDVMAVGDVVGRVSNAFDRYWNSANVYAAGKLIDEEPSEEQLRRFREHLLAFIEKHQDSEYLRALRDSDLARKIRDRSLVFSWGSANLLVDDPDKITNPRDAAELHLVTKLEPYFESLRDELMIVSPYFVPGVEGVEFLARLVERGVRVKVLTNSLASNDVAMVHAGYAKYRKPLLRAGVELYELNQTPSGSQRSITKAPGGSSRASLHAKTFVLDRREVFIGSLNLDPRSFYENTEIGLLIEQREIASNMAEWLHRELDQVAFRLELAEGGELVWHGYEGGKPVTFDVDPYTGFWQRFWVGLMRLLPIESQL